MWIGVVNWYCGVLIEFVIDGYVGNMVEWLVNIGVGYFVYVFGWDGVDDGVGCFFDCGCWFEWGMDVGYDYLI